MHPTRGLIEPKHSCALTVVIRATRELRLNGITLTANVRGGRQAKVPQRERARGRGREKEGEGGRGGGKEGEGGGGREREGSSDASSEFVA